MLEKEGLAVETLPLFDCQENVPGELPSAWGCYINYLRIGNQVVLPAYDLPEDQVALDTIRNLLPDAQVSQVPCRSLAERGGVLNCISWTIQDCRFRNP